MKIYQIHKMIELSDGNGWNSFGIETQSIQYARGFQDAVQMFNPTWTTRIVWVRGSRFEVVRMCGNWKPGN